MNAGGGAAPLLQSSLFGCDCCGSPLSDDQAVGTPSTGQLRAARLACHCYLVGRCGVCRKCARHCACPDFANAALTRPFNPSRLVVARQARGLLRSALAKQADVKLAWIAALERGEEEPRSFLEGWVRVRRVLDFPEGFFHLADIVEFGRMIMCGPGGCEVVNPADPQAEDAAEWAAEQRANRKKKAR